MPVFIYRAYVYGESGDIVAKGKTLPSYFLYKSEDKLTTELGKLSKGRYKIEIYAENAYGKKSECIEKTIEI